MSDETNSVLGRRKFLRNTGVAVGGLSLAATSVTAKEDSQSLEEAGLQEKYTNYLEQGEPDSAVALLKSNDIGHYHERQVHPENDESGGIGTQDYYNVKNSTVDFYTSKWAPGKRALSLSWDLSTNGGGYPDGPAPADLGVLAFEQDVFGYVGGTVQHSGSVGSWDGATSVAEKPVTGDPPNAMTVQFKDGAGKIGAPGNGYMQIVVRKQKSAVGRLAGQFAHAWSVSNLSSWGPGSASISLLGVISFSNPLGADTWVRGGSDDW